MSRTIDLTFLNNFTGGNADKKKKYISMFLSYCPGQLTEMKTHLDSGDYDALRGTAHALKPQVTYMGIKDGEELIKKIENVAATKNGVEELPVLLGNFNKICEQALVELKEEVS